MSEAGPAIARFTFANGMLRGTNLTLYPTSLVHRSDTHIETLPLAGMTAVRVAFQRDTRKLGWGIALVVLALILLAISGPIGNFASHNAMEMTAGGKEGVARMLLGFFRMLEGVASLLPVVALACVIGAGALGAFGWMGSTILLVSLPGAERIYSARGRDSMLLDFAEALSERLMLPKR
jgi:hypothetical protein